MRAALREFALGFCLPTVLCLPALLWLMGLHLYAGVVLGYLIVKTWTFDWEDALRP